MVPISSYYLGASAANAVSPAAFTRASQRPTLPSTPPSQSPKSSVSLKSPPAPPVERPSVDDHPTQSGESTPTTETTYARSQPLDRSDSSGSGTTNRSRPRNGTMNKSFKFPPEPVSSAPPVPNLPTSTEIEPGAKPVEIPPPTPIEKERPLQRVSHENDEDVGETVEVDLS